MRVGVTGASGSLGSALLDYAVTFAQGDEWVALARDPKRVKADVSVERRRFDVRDLSQADLSDLDCLVHFAYIVEEPRDKIEAWKVNVDGVVRLLDLCRDNDVSRVVLTSSVNAYGGVFGGMTQVDEAVPPSRLRSKFYFDQKASMELAVERWLVENAEYRRRVAIVRPSFVVGKHVSNSGVETFRSRLYVYPHAEASIYQFLWEEDFCRALCLIVAHEAFGVFNVAPDDFTTVAEMARMARARLISTPMWLAEKLADVGYALRISGYSSQWVTPGEAWVSSKLIREVCGWEASLSSSESFREFVI